MTVQSKAKTEASKIMERETGFEPATFCLGSRYSTAELLPQLRTCHDETINANHKQVNPTPTHDKDLCKTYHHCGLDPPVHRDENDEERSSSALQARTLAQRDRRLVNPEVRGRAYNKTTQTNNTPSPLMETFAKPTVIPA